MGRNDSVRFAGNLVLQCTLWSAAAPVLIALSICCTTPAVVSAQEPGTRVRVTARDGGQTVGTLESGGLDSVRVSLSGRREAYAMKEVRKVEVRGGRRRHTLQGVAIGALIGAGIGVLNAPTSHSDYCYPSLGDFLNALIGGSDRPNDPLVCGTSTNTEYRQGMKRGATLGALFGGLSGTMIRSDRWVPALLDNVSIGMTGSEKRAAFTASVRVR